MTDQKLILLNGLVPGNKYHLRITVTNDAGDTDAEYTFFTPMTYQDDPAVLLGSRAPSPVPFYADYLVLVPSVISFVVVVVLLSLVYIIFSRKPRHPPNDCIYGNFDGDNKLQSEANESVIMGDLDLNHNGKKGLNLESKYHANCPTQSQHQNQLPNVVQFQTPYARTDLADEKNLPLSQLNQLRGSPLKYNLDHDGIYATVKRGTPRAPRTADVHLYHFPRQSNIQQADILNLDSDSFDSSPHSHTNSATANATSGPGTAPWRSNTMAPYETEMTRLKKLPENLYGHNLFHDSSQ